MEHSLKLSNDFLPARLWLIDYYLRRGSNDVGLNLARTAPESQRGAPEIVIMMALCDPVADLGLEQQAALRRALLLRPSFITNYADQGITTLLRRYGGPLLDQLDTIVKKFPEFRSAHALLLTVMEAQGKPDQVITEVQKQVAANPKSFSDLLVLARLQIKRGEFKPARATLDKASELQPENPEVMIRIAEVEADSGQIDAALDQLRALTDRYPQSSQAWSFKGTFFQQQGSPNEARGYYEEALKLDSRNIVATNNLSLLLAVAFNDPKGGLEMARKAYALDPANSEVSDTLGWVLYLSGHYPEAAETLGNAVRMRPDNAGFRFHLAMAQRRSGRDR
jgi:Flp pilus assembly protein TadD